MSIMNPKKIRTGCNSIDCLLQGGIEYGAITQIYGESGSGKTNFCLQVAIQFIKNSINKINKVYNQFLFSIKNNLDIDYYKKIFMAAFEIKINISKNEKVLFYKKKMDVKTQIHFIKNAITKKYLKKVVYIDTEGISYERFKQIAGDSYKDIAKNILIYEPMNFKEQKIAIKKIENILSMNVRLIILDSATSYYRYELNDDKSNIMIRRELINQINYLNMLTRKYNIASIITNQVFSNINNNSIEKLKALGGTAIEHISKTILRFEKSGIGKRTIKIIKHRSIKEGISCNFQITNNGLI